MTTSEMEATADQLPVSVLTGFLGSGKTTVLNHLLRQPQLARTVVVINEFGEIGLDHKLIESATEDMVLLKSGCLCCTIRGELLDTLRNLYFRRARGEIEAFDRVMIETTGLADPLPILHTLMTDAVLARYYRLDGIITVVDASVGLTTLDRQPESVRQAAVADRLLLTKVDLAEPDTVTTLVDRLRALNPAAPIIPATQGVCNPHQLLNAGFYDPKTKSLDVQRWLNAEAYVHSSTTAAHAHEGHNHGHQHGHHDHDVNRHDAHIGAVCLTYDQPISGAAFDCWLDTLVMFKGPDLLRVKGMVNIADMAGPVVIHGVQHIFHPAVRMDRWPGDDRRTRIVFIGRDLDEAALRDTLALFADTEIEPAAATAP